MTPQQIEVMKQAQKALGVVTKEMMAIRDELGEYGEGRPVTNAIHQLLWDSAFKAYTETAIPAYAALEKALSEHAMHETQRLGQEIEQKPVPVTDNTYGYAKSLAEAIFKQHFSSDEHYASGRIVWGVNDSVIGILTQIDNMVADMVRRPEQPERHELQAKGEHPAPCARHCEANAFKIVIKNLKAQLAQPEQEPVAWMDADGNVSDNNDHKCFPIPLYTHPPQRTEQCNYPDCKCPTENPCLKGLAQPKQEPVAIERMKEWIEYLKYLKRTSDQHIKIPSEMSAGTCWELALDLEQFINTTQPQRKWVGAGDLENSNAYLTPPQPEQVPVAWPCLIDSADFSENTITVVMQCEDYKVSAGTHWLSTTPPQRTWVGLSVFEITDLVDSIEYEEYQDLVKKTEAKLKEKNT